MGPLLTLAREYRLAVVEDAAHAFPAHLRGRPAGTLGVAGAFSFYATKNLTTGEGGMLTTDSDALAERARMMSLHGISRDAWLRYTAQGSWYYEILEPGYKYNMTDIAAALGLEQLRRGEDLWRIRRQYAARYTEAFRELPEVETPPDAHPGDRHAWHLYVLRLNLERLTLDRAAFIEALRERGIGASVHFIPLHLHPYYRETYGYRPADLPVATAAYERLVSLPLYPRMTAADVQRVIDAVVEITRTHRA
jgi:perosamine synthetase